MNKFIGVFIGLLILLSSCHSKLHYVQLADNEILKFSKEMKEKHGLKLFSSGGGFQGGINSLTLSFSGNHQFTLEESRVFFISLTQKFIDSVNSNNELRPYLTQYPFTEKNLDFTILLPCYSINEFSSYISSISMMDIYNFDNRPTVILYTIIDNDCVSSRIIHKETYKQALEYVDKLKK